MRKSLPPTAFVEIANAGKVASAASLTTTLPGSQSKAATLADPVLADKRGNHKSLSFYCENRQ
jgi:hypothetical protein